MASAGVFTGTDIAQALKRLYAECNCAQCVALRPTEEEDMAVVKGLGVGIGVKGWTREEALRRSQDENRRMLVEDLQEALSEKSRSVGVSTGRDENVTALGGIKIPPGVVIKGVEGLQGRVTASGKLSVGGTGVVRIGGNSYKASEWVSSPWNHGSKAMLEPMPVEGLQVLPEDSFTPADIEMLGRFAENAGSGPVRDWLVSMRDRVSAAYAEQERKKVTPMPLPEEPIPSREVKPLDLELIKVG